jgi:hypothetical protein
MKELTSMVGSFRFPSPGIASRLWGGKVVSSDLAAPTMKELTSMVGSFRFPSPGIASRLWGGKVVSSDLAAPTRES